MPASIPEPVQTCQPETVRIFKYRPRMARQPSDYLWQTLCALTGLVNPSIDEMRAALKGKVGRGTVQRIKDGEGHRATDVLRDIAEVFGIEVWQLLVPGVTRDAIPHLDAASVFSPDLLASARKAPAADVRQAENAARGVLGLGPLPPIPRESGELRPVPPSDSQMLGAAA